MGSKQDQKDPTVALENQRRAMEQTEFLTKSSGVMSSSSSSTAPSSKVTLSKHIDSLKNNILYDMNPSTVVVSG